MRTLAIIAVAVLTAMPAAAQDNNAASTAPADNVAIATDDTVSVSNDAVAAPAPAVTTPAPAAEAPVATTEPAPRQRSKTFPWGVLGLLGLVGLLGRFRR